MLTDPIVLKPFYVLIFIMGLVSGSFICEVADRLPRHEDFIKGRSHCEACGTVLEWFELVPVLSYLFLHGRCRHCKTKLSPRYPLLELFNGCLWLWTAIVYGISTDTLLFCLLSSALLGLSLIDLKTFEIPVGFNIFILVLAVIRLFTAPGDLPGRVIGFFIISAPLLLISFLSKGKAMGGGDIKLMAAGGLLIGWKAVLAAFVIACILGSIIHLIRMKFFGAGRQLALGPYLAAGLFLSALYGEKLIELYINVILR